MAIHVPLAGMVVAIAVAGRMMDWTTVTVTVEARIAGLEAEVDREVGVEVDTPVVRLDEELFAVVKLVEEVFDAVVAALMQEQALRIFEDEDLQPELIAEGVEIAIFVAYVLQKEDA
jgi:predicted NAD/FAD-binding protein